MSASTIALHRFGLGARPDEPPPGEPKRWLIEQLDRFEVRSAAITAAPTSGDAAAILAEYYQEQQALRGNGATTQSTTPIPAMQDATMTPAVNPKQAVRREAARVLRDQYAAAVKARVDAALVTPAPFAERLVHFWANHFAVSTDKLAVVGLAGTLEFEAIRPHLLGRFGDMLGAVERHPAMLLYLDQAQSVGAASPLGSRVAARGQRKIGLNENLAREILELHTLGVRTGYTQTDVTEFARALTGWTVSGIGRGAGARLAGGTGEPGRFVFAPAIHEPGDRMVVGKQYLAGGEAQAQAVLDDLAVHPATARHLATKLARHFIADVPPPAAVARIEQAFLRSGGDLPNVYRALVDAPEAWADGTSKFRTPWEWTVAVYRGLGARQAHANVLPLFTQLGQPVWRPGQPSGWDDVAASWAGPDAVMRRVVAASRLAERASGLDARALAPKLFPAGLSAATKEALARAETGGQALALLLVSPEMMRR
jgi:uncharacterized protein (DUF1800 family)